jgi:hypothetical protein
VIPISKKWSKKEAWNYGPVLITSNPCKILESLIKDDIMGHLLANKPMRQLLCLEGSCTTNLLTFQEQATAAKDSGEQCFGSGSARIPIRFFS